MRKRHTAAFKAKIVQEVFKEEKTIAQIASEYGIHPTQISTWKSVALKGLPSVFEKADTDQQAEKEEHEKQLQELYAQITSTHLWIGRLTTQVAWLKKNLASNLLREERIAFIEREASSLPLSVQADLLSVSRASLYYQPTSPSVEEVALKNRIDEIYTAYPFYGSRRIAAQMKREGLQICRNTAARYMQEMGIAAVYPGPNLSRRDSQHKVYPYLLRGLTIEQPNAVWGIDSTYIRLNRGWMYLVAVLDWYSRYVVSWELDQTLEMPFVLAAVDTALGVATPQIWNSDPSTFGCDQGSHFTSPQYIERLQKRGIRISMDALTLA